MLSNKAVALFCRPSPEMTVCWTDTPRRYCLTTVTCLCLKLSSVPFFFFLSVSCLHSPLLLCLFRRMTFGKVNELGQFIREAEPEPDVKKSKGKSPLGKFWPPASVSVFFYWLWPHSHFHVAGLELVCQLIIRFKKSLFWKNYMTRVSTLSLLNTSLLFFFLGSMFSQAMKKWVQGNSDEVRKTQCQIITRACVVYLNPLVTTLWCVTLYHDCL